MAAGDIDGEGTAEVVIARAGTPDVSIVQRSALAGVTSRPGPVTLLAEPAFIAVGDVLSDVGNLQEVVAADGSTVRVYRWNGTSLAPVDAVTTTYTVTGLAVGDVVGTSADDIVATTTGGTDADNRIVIATGGSGTLVVDGT